MSLNDMPASANARVPEVRIERGALAEGLDGPLGHVSQIVMNENTGELQAIVLSNESTQDVAVPASCVVNASGDQVLLNIGRADLSRVGTPYDPAQYSPVHEDSVLPPSEAGREALFRERPVVTSISGDTANVVLPETGPEAPMATDTLAGERPPTAPVGTVTVESTQATEPMEPDALQAQINPVRARAEMTGEPVESLPPMPGVPPRDMVPGETPESARIPSGTKVSRNAEPNDAPTDIPATALPPSEPEDVVIEIVPETRTAVRERPADTVGNREETDMAMMNEDNTSQDVTPPRRDDMMATERNPQEPPSDAQMAAPPDTDADATTGAGGEDVVMEEILAAEVTGLPDARNQVGQPAMASDLTAQGTVPVERRLPNPEEEMGEPMPGGLPGWVGPAVLGALAVGAATFFVLRLLRGRSERSVTEGKRSAKRNAREARLDVKDAWSSVKDAANNAASATKDALGAAAAKTRDTVSSVKDQAQSLTKANTPAPEPVPESSAWYRRAMQSAPFATGWLARRGSGGELVTTIPADEVLIVEPDSASADTKRRWFWSR